MALRRSGLADEPRPQVEVMPDIPPAQRQTSEIKTAWVERFAADTEADSASAQIDMPFGSRHLSPHD